MASLHITGADPGALEQGCTIKDTSKTKKSPKSKHLFVTGILIPLLKNYIKTVIGCLIYLSVLINIFTTQKN